MVNGKILRKARQRLGESQIEFAKRLGVHQSVVSRLEREERKARGPVLLLIQRVLGELREAAE